MAWVEGGRWFGGVAAPGLGGGGREAVLPELEQVVGGGDQPPLGAAGAEASSLEAVGAAVVLGLSEHRLDSHRPLAVELFAFFAG